MLKYLFANVMEFCPERTGARYKYKDHYYNNGECVECSIAKGLGWPWTKDHVPFDKGSDIEEKHISIKSFKATLADPRLFNSKTFDEQVNEYIERTASNVFIWGNIQPEGVMAYIMTKKEFRHFLTAGFWKVDKSRNSIRQMVCAKKVIEWCESQI